MGKDFDIALLRAAVVEGRIHWHLHALERFLERGISRAEVVNAILHGEVMRSMQRIVPILVVSFCTLRRTGCMSWPLPNLPARYAMSSRPTVRTLSTLKPIIEPGGKSYERTCRTVSPVRR